MARGGVVTKRKRAIADEKYKDERINRFINYIMQCGKKSVAQKIVYGALQKAADTLKEEPVAIFEKVMASVKPEVEVRSRRVGGASYQVPVPVPLRRGEAMAMRWVIDAARGRKGKPMMEKLAEELINAYNGQSDAIKKRENVHKMADANRAFAHFKW